MSAVGRYRKPAPLANPALGLGARHAVVEASAGTGKTYLLEHLVVDLLLTREVPLDQILVVTFTEKATAELVDRIRRKLEELAALTGDHPNAVGAPDQDCWRIDERARRRLRDALFSFDRAAISTIHAFCQRLLREHAFLNQRLFDEQAVDEEQAFEAAFAEVLRRDLPEGSQGRRLMQVWLSSGGDLGKVKRAVLNAHRKLAGSTGDVTRALRPGLDELTVLSAAAAVIARPPEVVKAALKAEKVHGTTANTVERRLNTLLAELAGPVAARDLIGVAAGVKNAEAATDKFFDKLEEYFEANPRSETMQSLRAPIATLIGATDPLGLLVAHLLPAVARRLEATKRESGLYDFQDMLTLVARSLEGDGEGARSLLATLRARYRHALIDEFQDTDEVQWDIFRRIFFDSGQGHVLTVIGDPKQAIYGFRGADVFTYLSASQVLTGAGGASLPLAENFRSTAPLIGAYNAILDQDAPFFRPQTGIRYDHPVTCGRPDLALVDGGGQPAPGLVVLDLQTEKSRLLTFEVKRALLDRMAREIQGLLAGATDSGPLAFGPAGDPTPVRARDIYVLTRTTRESREVGDVLRAARVPFAYFKQEKLFQTIEAREVLDLLRAIADPDDVTARARAFITPFFSLGLVDLAACDELDGSHALLRMLYEWRGLAEDGAFETLFARVVDDSGIVCRELFFRDSERSLTNYLHLLEILQEEAMRSRATIRELCQTLGAYILGTRRPPGDARDTQRLETEADAVQIMTIHHSKGLEAPVVFLYGGFWTPPFNDVRALHEGSAEAPRRIVRVGRQPGEEKARYEAEQDDEERRVLYVALTRAKGRLYLPRFPRAFEQLRGCYRFIQQRLDEILNGITPPEVRGLFHQVPVPCPVVNPLALAEAPAASVQAWAPAPALLADDEAGAAEAHRALVAPRSGFVMTSYSAVKGRHGGFVPADPIEGAVDPTASDGDTAAATPAAPDPLPSDVLPRGRLTGRFLHEVIEEVPLATLAGATLDTWAARPEIAALFERKRRRHDRSPVHVPHAQRLIYAALTRPLQLGEATLPGLATTDRVLREMEFLYPIPERDHPLLGQSDADGRTFSIQRGMVKGFIDLLFEHDGRSYVCDWKGDWLPSWKPEPVALHCDRNYSIQAQLYTLAAVRWLGLGSAEDYQARFGGVVYIFLRGLEDGPGSGVYFRRPSWEDVLAWQAQMLDADYWRFS